MSLYDNRAKYYDNRHDSPSTIHLRTFEKRVLKKYASGKVLDIGCGTGYHLKFLKTLKYKNISAIGIDKSRQMIDSSNLPVFDTNNISSISVQQASAEKLPFQDKSFDTVLCMFSTLNLLGDKEVSEIQRVMKNNGLLIISVASIWDKKGPSFFEKKNMKIENHMKFKKVSIDKHNLSFRLFTKKDLVEYMKSFGLSLVDFQGIFVYQRPYWGRFEDFSISEKIKLFFDKLQQSGDLGAMYLAVFSKN
ncbi:MAG: class I SAM-dependent methyltransferase [Candidatus Aenigmarchaeota archaeon]|nr:class I SAM-dependent methyltransferase [Candidatus Aenigmarchaeota archaeon]